MNNMKITVDAKGKGTIILNGQDLSDQVVAIGYNSAPDEPTEVTLVMRVDDLDIEAEVEDEHFQQVDHRVKGDDDGQEYGHPGDHLKGLE
jgi:hypothetical protein